MPIFKDRSDAGRKLAAHIKDIMAGEDLIVLGLPRGGVPVAYEVARALGAPLDVFVVRKIGVPGDEEFAMGAIASGGIRIINEAVVRQAGVSDNDIAVAIAQEQLVLDRRERIYRGEYEPLALANRSLLVVDDGMATGSSMKVAVLALKARKPAAITVAVPVASQEACDYLAKAADRVICLETPTAFGAVGKWYVNFVQTPDEQVLQCLAMARQA